MAAAKAGSKRKRNRKARTEVSSSSDSDSDSHSPTTSREQSTSTSQKRQPSSPTQTQDLPKDSPQPSSHRQQKTLDPQQAFSDFYLRQATKEFGDDLVKLRNANDFSAAGVEVLVAALRQGEACFGAKERERVGAAAGAADEDGK